MPFGGQEKRPDKNPTFEDFPRRNLRVVYVPYVLVDSFRGSWNLSRMRSPNSCTLLEMVLRVSSPLLGASNRPKPTPTPTPSNRAPAVPSAEWLSPRMTSEARLTRFEASL